MTGSYIIDMGVVPQTVGNGVKPYGLIHDLVNNNQIPVYWAIDDSKTKDGVDFSVDGLDFSGGPFVIPQAFVAAALPVINAWVAKGVVVHEAQSQFTAPASGATQLLTYVPFAVGTNDIIQDAFYDDSEIPAFRLQNRPFELDGVTPSAETQGMGRCEDVMAMPHEDPQEWTVAERERFACFVDPDGSSSGVNCTDVFADNSGAYTRVLPGSFWAACRSVSATEALVPDGFLGLNFLSNTSLIDWNTHSNNGSPPYTYPATSTTISNVHASNPMQFIGLVDDALRGGSEEIYIPDANGWRDTTTLGVYDPTNEDIDPGVPPDAAAVVAFGDAYGDPDNGFVVYEASHTIQDNGEQQNVAAARIYGNFLLTAGVRTGLVVDSVTIPSPLSSGDVVQLDISLSGGSGIYQYNWTDTCGGTFSDPAIANPTYTVPNDALECTITVAANDDCDRSTFAAEEVAISNLELVKDGPLEACTGDVIDYTLTPSLQGDGNNVTLNDLCVIDSAPAGTSLISTDPPQIGGQWCLGGTVVAVNGIDPGNPSQLRSTKTFSWPAIQDTYLDDGKNSDNWYGDDDEIKVDEGTTFGLLKFQEPAGFDAAIAQFGATFVSAKIELSDTDGKGGDDSLEFYQLTTDWTEGTSDDDGATLEDPDGFNTASTWAAGDFSTADYDDSTTLATIDSSQQDVVAASDEVGTNLRDLVSDWADGTVPNYGVVLADVAPDDKAKFRTKESAEAAPVLRTVIQAPAMVSNAGSRINLNASPVLIIDSGVAIIDMNVFLQYYDPADGDIAITPPDAADLIPNITGTVTVGVCTGPVPASAVYLAADSALGATNTFTYTCPINAPETLTNAITWTADSDDFTVVGGDPEVVLVDATSNNIIVSPELTLSAVVTAVNGTISNIGTADDILQGAADSNTVDTDINLPNNCTPTWVSVGDVQLGSIGINELLNTLRIEGLSRDQLLRLLANWSPAPADSLRNADLPTILTAIENYLDPDGDGNVALLQWKTFVQQGTVGFYIERELTDGERVRINGQMLSAMDAPLGADYLLVDPGVTAGIEYRYYLVELEADGSTLEYGPFDLQMP